MIDEKRYAAIDVGTNAVRLVVKGYRSDVEHKSWSKLCYTRLPIRLGEDVFVNSVIGHKKRDALAKSFLAFKNIMDVMEVESYRACSTSAMREADNADEVISYISKVSGIELEVLSGKEEARLIKANFGLQNLNSDKYYLYIDVGGGSTEVSLIYDSHRIMSQSFRIGTVRELQGTSSDEDWSLMEEYCRSIGSDYADVVAIGTGGNINKIFKESGVMPNKLMSLDDIIRVQEYLSSYTHEQRISELNMRPDRSDVILIASDIYIKILRWADVRLMSVPKVGLSDGIILDLHLRAVGV